MERLPLPRPGALRRRGPTAVPSRGAARAPCARTASGGSCGTALATRDGGADDVCFRARLVGRDRAVPVAVEAAFEAPGRADQQVSCGPFGEVGQRAYGVMRCEGQLTTE